MKMEQTIQRNAVIYCRVSTKEQAEEGNSLISQERNCREYAQKNRYQITQVFIEEGESAKTADRTELQKLLRVCSDKKQNIQAVIIYKIDRLSRNTDDYSQLRILLKRYGIEIKSTSEYFENTPAGRFMGNIIANVAQFDNDVRTERSVGGMREAVREGRYVWVAPVGYINQRVAGKSTIVQSEKAPLVKKAFELMAEKKYSFDAISSTLSSIGLTTRHGKYLSKSAFYTMLKNELYTGWIYKFGEKHKGNFEPIISEELFNRVQQVMRNKKQSLIYRIENPDFPLRRFVRHPQKYKLTGAWSKGRNKSYAYYRFTGTQLYWPKDYVESLFRSFIDEFSFNELLLIKLRDAMCNYLRDKSKNSEDTIETLITMKQQLKSKQQVLLQKNIQGIISDVLLKEQLNSLDEEIWNIDKLLLQKETRKVDIKTILDYISEFLSHPSLVWGKLPLKNKLELQWFQFPEGVTFDGSKFRTTKISCLFKLKELFADDVSCKVPYSGLNYEHTNPSNSPPLPNDTSVVWDELKKDLLRLQECLTPTTTEIDQSPVLFPHPD